MPKSRPARGQSAAPLIAMIVLLVLILVCGAFFIARAVRGTSEPAVTTEPSGTTTPAQTTDPSQTDLPSSDTTAPDSDTSATPDTQKWITVTQTAGDVHTGTLQLVNYEHEYVFPSFPNTVTFYGNKTAKYKLRNTSVSVTRETLDAFNALVAAYNEQTGVNDLIVISGYRDYESQKTTYSNSVKQNGVAYAEKYVAQAGYSEHHTGLCVDLAIYTDDGKQLSLGSEKTYPTFLELAASYGFVLRYDPSKTDITHIGGEEWHFRYVGYPHSYYMTVKDLCLEEYITMLHTHTFDGEHLCFADGDSQSWEIYYVPSEGNSTQLPVPADAPYTVSGDNISGYIVTVSR